MELAMETKSIYCITGVTCKMGLLEFSPFQITKFTSRNHTKYMSVQHILKTHLDHWGYLLTVNFVSTAKSKQHPKSTRHFR